MYAEWFRGDTASQQRQTHLHILLCKWVSLKKVKIISGGIPVGVVSHGKHDYLTCSYVNDLYV